jgi:hypothetical protein
MRNLLTKHGIPADTLSNAVEFLTSADDATVRAFNREFGLTMTGSDAVSAARFAADAIFRGAGAVDKVVGYVAKRMTGMAASAAPVAAERVVMVGAPVVDSPEVVIVPVVTIPTSPSVTCKDGKVTALKVKGKRGRKRLGDSDFAKVVGIIEANPKAERQTVMDCIVAAGIKQSSAAVYLWRYHTKGERE